MMGVTSGAGMFNPCGTSQFTAIFLWVVVAQSLVFCVVFCKLLFVPFFLFFWPLYCLVIFDSQLSSDKAFGIFKLFFLVCL
jgi:hypothetical protein